MKIFEPNITDREIELVVKTLKENQVSGRCPTVYEFEKKFSEYVGVKHAVTCNSGSTALFLALKALKLTGEVIIPSFAYIAVADAVSQAGLTPVLVDSSSYNPNLDPYAVECAITPRTSAIICVDTYGIPCSPELREIAEHYGLTLIEDLAEAVGKRGIMGRAACYSFFANKTMTTGEGGIICTNDTELYDELMRITQRIGREPFVYPYMTYSMRMSGVQAALGIGQLERIEEFQAIKDRNAKLYFAGLPEEISILKDGLQWVVSCLAPTEEDRDEILKLLKENDIETRKFFPPIHIQKMYLHPTDSDQFPNSEDYWQRGFCLPSGTLLKVEDINKVISIIKQWKNSR